MLSFCAFSREYSIVHDQDWEVAYHNTTVWLYDVEDAGYEVLYFLYSQFS